MASYGLLNRGDPCFQSPAKAFARLRSNVPKEPVCNVRERDGNGVRTRSKATKGRVCGAGGPVFNPNPAAFCRGGEQKENDRFASPEAKAQELLRSPSREETFGCFFSPTGLEHLDEQFPLGDTVGGSTRRHRRVCTDPSTEDPAPLQANRKRRGDGAQNNTGRQDPGSVKGFPGVCLDPASMLSPAKLFAQMKERESHRGHQRSPTPGRRELFAGNERNLEECRDTDVSTIYSMERTMDFPVMSTVKQVAPVNQDQSELPERARGTSEDILTPASPSAVAPLEDSLVLSTPHVSIPKKNKTVFRRNSSPKIKKFPSESVIHLRKWFLRRSNRGLFVDGIHVEKNVPWNSNVVTERISRSALMTVSGRVYILVGAMKIKLATDFPTSFLKKFLKGFPLNWKTLYETFLSRDRQERNNDTGRTRIQSVKTPNTSLPASCSSFNVSRSGRVIKPPLEYWKGGRVIVDAQMNVTVLQSYETPCPDLSTSLCPMMSEKATPFFLPGSDGSSQHGSPPDEESSVPVRRVKADRKQNRAQANRYQKPADLSTEMNKSPEEVSVKTRSSTRRRCLDAGPQKQGEPERPPSRRSKKTSSPPQRTTETVTNLPQSPRRLRRGRAGHGTKGTAARNKSELEPNVSANQSPKALTKNRKEQKNNSRVKKPVAVSSSAAKPSSRTRQPGKRSHPKRGSASPPHQTDEDNWTKEEIEKLQTAVGCYPKHAAGYWAKVASLVVTRSAEECYRKHTSQGATPSPVKSAKNRRKVKKGEAAAAKPAEVPVISARRGTLKRKQQVRQFLEALPREDMDDAFSSEYMKNKRMEIPSLCSSEDLDLALSDLEPQTPESSDFLEVKTPQCLHITPGMIGSPSTHTDNRYVFQLQKRMRKNRFDVCKTSSSSKKFKITPSVRRTVRRCINTAENDAFTIHEMVPENSSELYDSDEEDDFYFSDS
ncbi:mis18-binding protein 1 [Fundulus diaphanus]